MIRRPEFGEWVFFDPEACSDVSQGNLPHLQQAAGTYFITFRLDDSVPAALMRRWHAERADWLRRRGVEPSTSDSSLAIELLSAADRRAYTKQFTRRFEGYLDRGLGSCVLADPTASALVADSLEHFDGDRYRLGAYVVMPNHVHVLAMFILRKMMLEQCYSWKHYTAGEVKRSLGFRRRRLWQSESFDHLVRGPEQFEKFVDYIAANPDKAHLSDGEYRLVIK